MSNIIKYSETSATNSIQSGNFNVGVNNTSTNLTGFFNGISPIVGGYTIYVNKVSGGPSIYSPKNDSELVSIANRLGANVETAVNALVWINSQSNMTVLNNNYPSIVTSGMVLNLDAGFVSSYPKTGTTWRDLSGNNNLGTLLNSPLFENNSLVFNGSGKRATTQSSLSSTFLTASIWYRRDDSVSSSTWRTIMATLSTNIHHLILQDSTRILGIWDGSFKSFGYTPPNDGLFHNLCVVYQSGVNASLYVDGVFISTVNTTLNFSTSPISSIGNWGGNNYWAGYISQVQIFNRQLTTQEIIQNYQAGLQRLIPTNGLVLSLDAQNTNLYATSPTTAYDISGNDKNGTLVNGTQIIGNGDGSWRFDGVDDRITFSNPLNQSNLSQEWSICCWVNISNNTTQTLISGLNSGIHLNWSTTNRPLLYLNSGVNDYYIYGDTNRILNQGWTHVCFSFRNSDGYRKIFINSIDRSAFGPNQTSTPSGIGSTFTVGSGLNGNLSNIDFYNRVLTQAEITTIFNATKSRYGL